MAKHNAQSAASKPNKATAAQSRKDAQASAEKTPNKVDDASEQTFPASDAPASWAGKDIAPQDREAAQKKRS